MNGSKIGIVVFVFAVLSGCASGPAFKDVQPTFGAAEPGSGRIFYRPEKFFGGGIRPDVLLNGELVGNSTPGGFFYIDRPSGDYRVSMTSEVEKALTFTLDERQTRYVRLSVGLGVIVYRVYPELKDESEALPELQTLSYVGKQ